VYCKLNIGLNLFENSIHFQNRKNGVKGFLLFKYTSDFEPITTFTVFLCRHSGENMEENVEYVETHTMDRNQTKLAESLQLDS
jgi:hypothetical protein